MIANHLVLAGGGHTHALLLLRWAMYPKLRPKGLITLISRKSTTFYSGMVPGLIAGYYLPDEAIIDLAFLANQAGAAFVSAEIIGISSNSKLLLLKDRPSINFDIISINVGAETPQLNNVLLYKNRLDLIIPIKPLETSLAWIKKQDSKNSESIQNTLTIVGAGHTGVEVALALRKRWPRRKIQIKVNDGQPKLTFRRALLKANIEIITSETCANGPILLCTGSRPAKWIQESSLPVDNQGRLLTTRTLQVVNHPDLFAAGDCAVLCKDIRPPSGVWAVRAATPLAKNLEAYAYKQTLVDWRPQRRALQLIGGCINSNKSVAWAVWGKWIIGPFRLLWFWKELIDRKFISRFDLTLPMQKTKNLPQEMMFCKGCAAKVAALPLQKALKKANLFELGEYPVDASFVDPISKYGRIIQSVDGFPALVSDPWLNGRITALHACSDIWARGGTVISAQAVITVPAVSTTLQQELLAQTLEGIQSALKPQGAELLGGHTLEARHPSPSPISLGVQIAITVNGLLREGRAAWSKGGMEPGDILLLSRKLGSGVIFAAAMVGSIHPKDLEAVRDELETSQYDSFMLLQELQEKYPEKKLINACTDVTGFGLLGHLGEMIKTTNFQRKFNREPSIFVQLYGNLIPAYNGSLELLNNGFYSTLSPSNRVSLELLGSYENDSKVVELITGKSCNGFYNRKSLIELIVDPQTCGPLLISCPSEIAEELINTHLWHKIGEIYQVKD